MIKGEYSGRMRIVDHRPAPKMEPLSAYGEKLLIEFFRRDQFETMISLGATQAWAAKMIFDVGDGRASAIRAEMPDGALQWFHTRAMEGIKAGKIAGGRSTLRSPLADCFFRVLAGGEGGIRDLRDSVLGPRSVVKLPDVYEGFSERVAECTEYLTASNLFWAEEEENE
jgi:hypothetical protein